MGIKLIPLTIADSRVRTIWGTPAGKMIACPSETVTRTAGPVKLASRPKKSFRLKYQTQLHRPMMRVFAFKNLLLILQVFAKQQFVLGCWLHKSNLLHALHNVIEHRSSRVIYVPVRYCTFLGQQHVVLWFMRVHCRRNQIFQRMAEGKALQESWLPQF